MGRSKKGIFGFNWSSIPWGPLLLVGGGIYLISKAKTFLDPLTNLLPGGNSPEVKAAAAATVWAGTGAFIPSGASYHGITQTWANSNAESIFYATRSFSVNVDSPIIAIFKQFAYQSQVAKFVDTFRANYGLDLYSFLLQIMSNAGLSQIVNYVNSLPTGVIV